MLRSLLTVSSSGTQKRLRLAPKYTSELKSIDGGRCLAARQRVSNVWLLFQLSLSWFPSEGEPRSPKAVKRLCFNAIPSDRRHSHADLGF